MGASPELPGESYIETSEKQKELAEVLLMPEFIDNLAQLKEFSSCTDLVGGFAVYKNGRFEVGEIIVPPERGSRQNSHRICHWQEGFHHRFFKRELASDLFMIVHSHPANNFHCQKEDPEDLSMPTFDDISEWWYENGFYNPNLIGAILSCDGASDLCMFLHNKKGISGHWDTGPTLKNVVGHDIQTVSKDIMKRIMVSSEIATADIPLNCDKTTYKRRVNKALPKLYWSPV